MNWRDHATPDELVVIEDAKKRQSASHENCKAESAIINQVYERCRKRMERSK